MHTRVEINSNTPSLECSILWLIYFFFSIGWVGAIFAFTLSAPFFLLGRLIPFLEPIADRILFFGIQLLMKVQPWLNGKIQIEIPEHKTHSSVGTLFVSNHRSHLDSFILLSRIPGLRIFAKKTLFYVPFLGIMMWMTRQIPAQRGKLDSFFKGIEMIRKRLRRGDFVHIFPEMKRCPLGFRGIQDFSLAPFLIAIQEKVTMVPILFIDTDQVWPKGTFGLRYRYPLEVRTLPSISPQYFTSAEELRNEVMRQMNEALL